VRLYNLAVENREKIRLKLLKQEVINKNYFIPNILVPSSIKKGGTHAVSLQQQFAAQQARSQQTERLLKATRKQMHQNGRGFETLVILIRQLEARNETLARALQGEKTARDELAQLENESALGLVKRERELCEGDDL
jgi:hypothetical protein